MKTALISFGDELLQGIRVNTNAQEIASLLRSKGLFLDSILELPDREDKHLEDVLKLLFSKTSLVITTGGLGPTGDDQTRALFARLYRRSLFLDKTYAEGLKKRVGNAYPIEEVSTIPEDSLLLPNTIGTACGFAFKNVSPFPETCVIVLPGPPDEMKPMLEAHLDLLPHSSPKRYLRFLFLFGRGEHEIYPLLPKIEGVDVGIYPSYGVVELFLSSRKKESLELFEKKVKEQFPLSCSLGTSSLSLEKFVIQALIDKKYTIACAESCTGGFISSLLTSVPGSSKTFLGSVVVYSEESKRMELSLTHEFIEQHGTVSEEMARALSLECQKKFASSIGVGIVGYLEPTGDTKNVPCGTVYISLAVHRSLFQKKVLVRGDRKESQKKAALYALSFLAEKLFNGDLV